MKHTVTPHTLIIVLLVVLWPIFGNADVLELKSGRKIEGQFSSGSKEEIYFQTGSQLLRFKLDEVSKITLGTPIDVDLPKSRKEVLQELRAFSSIIDAAVNYRDYSSRLLDVKVKADQFLNEDNSYPEFNQHVKDSLGFFVAASSLWKELYNSPLARIATYMELVKKDVYVQKCFSSQPQYIAEKKKGRFPCHNCS